MSAKAYLRSLLKAPALIVVAILLVLAARGSGMSGAVDEVFRGYYYAFEGTRESSQRVLFVAVGPQSVSEWGPAAQWEERLTELSENIAQGEPTVVAFVGPHRLLSGRGEDELGGVARVAPSLAEDWQGNVNSLALDQGGDEGLSLREFLALTPLKPPDGDVVQIHYLHPRDRLPRVEAHRVASGEIPPSTFAGRIVLIGLTAAPFTLALPTPVGNMPLAEIQAQALLSLADQASWPASSWGATFLILLLVPLGAAIGRKLDGVQALGACLGVSVVLVVIDYNLFSRGVALLGASAGLLGVWSGFAALTLERQYRASQTLSALSTQVREGSPSPLAPKSDEEWEDFWLDLASLGRNYVDTPHTAMVAELPEDAWHLVVRACDGCEEQDIAERRRDIRRSPFRAGYLSHRAGWAEDFIAGEERSLMVPLIELGQIYGFWILNLDPGIALSEEEIAEIEGLAVQMAQSIAKRRNRERKLAEPSAGDMSGAMKVLSQGIETMSQSKDWSRALAEQLPVGLMVATIFGHIEFQNKAMQDHLALDFPDGAPNEDIRAVIAQLTGSTLGEAHEIMRDVIKSDRVLKLQSQLKGLPQLRGDPRLSLTRLHLDTSTNFLGESSGNSEYLLLIARPGHPDTAASDDTVGLQLRRYEA